MQALKWRAAALLQWLAADLCTRVIHCAARIPALRVLPRFCLIPIERALIGLRGQGLFDPEFYRLQNADVAQSGDDPFAHYLRHGWREGRAPNARFDDGHYRVQAALRSSAPVSALAHFVALGQTGGLCPVPGIDLGGLISSYPDLAVARMNPYRRILREDALDCRAVPDVATLRAELASLPAPGNAKPAIDVIIPIYDGHAETLNTLLHVLRARTDAVMQIIAVNDQSPDSGLIADLCTLESRGLISLVHQGRNLGFVNAINRGMQQHPSRDVIWLNSDTEVFDGWADRLRGAAYSGPKVATVTPLTNNGTICSYPRLNADTPGPLEISWQAIDRLAASANRGLRLDAPTAVGFATYVRRDAIQNLGLLDYESFGRGYGEENDFSQRAIRNGWANLIAADVFVRHIGAISFKGSRSWRIERALQVMDDRYPDYRRDVQTFLSEDPLQAARKALDVARLRRLAADQNVLLITHSLGGGTQQHVLEEIDRLTRRGISVFLMSGGARGNRTARLTHANAAALPSLECLSVDEDALWGLIAQLGIGHAHIHHLIDFAPNVSDVISERLSASGISYDFVVHDYLAICPRINLVDNTGSYCGEPDVGGCQKCIIRRGTRFGRPDIVDWRKRYHRLFSEARSIRVPDRDVRDRLLRYMPDLAEIEVRPHEGPIVPVTRPPKRRVPGPLRIAVVGAIGATKGFDVILDLQKEINRTRLPAALTVIGYTHNDAIARSAGIVVTGPYVNDDVDDLISAADPDLIWIPSVWPETYSYTLSIALRSGRPVAAFETGALETRLRAAGRGTLIPLDLVRQPNRLYQMLRDAVPEVAELSELSA